MFDGKSVVMGVTGGIAAYKACEVARSLTNRGIDVHVVMTRAATRFVAPLTFQTLTGNVVHTDLFNLLGENRIGHIDLARRGQVILVAPATANVIGKVAAGIADDFLTTVVMATRAPVIFAPAMNVAMWENPVVQENIRKLTGLGYSFIEPMEGETACGEEGRGKLAEVETILETTCAALTDKILAGKKVLVNAGPTREPLDPVRFLSNRSSGRMGYALARVAAWMGAKVTLVSGPAELPDPPGVGTVRVETAREMLAAVRKKLRGLDVLIAAAAVADLAPVKSAKHKLPKDEIPAALDLAPAPDILIETKSLRQRVFTVGFAAETRDLEARARRKMEAKRLDMICANDVSRADIGFEAEENALTVFLASGEKEEIPKQDKEAVAAHVLRLIADALP